MVKFKSTPIDPGVNPDLNPDSDPYSDPDPDRDPDSLKNLDPVIALASIFRVTIQNQIVCNDTILVMVFMSM
uniref:Uncharacterized protein n=1 Tax=Plectus sambesii TaxID=2011161 RepID=A0A914WDX0_9BILA